VDLFCWGMTNHIPVDGTDLLNDASSHTISCMRDLQPCRNGGFGILEKSGSTYHLKYTFDAGGATMALAALDATKGNPAYVNNFVVSVTGSLDTSSSPPLMTVHSLSASDPSSTITGLLVDLFCWGMTDHIAVDGTDLLHNAPAHTISCMRDLVACRTSGFGLLSKQVGGDWDLVYVLDAAGNTLALNALDATKNTPSYVNDFVVSIVGTVDTSTSPPVISVASLAYVPQTPLPSPTPTPTPTPNYVSPTPAPEPGYLNGPLTTGGYVGAGLGAAFGWVIVLSIVAFVYLKAKK